MPPDTANLASFLVAESISPAINDWADIVASNGALSLALPRGSTQMQFLEYEKHHYKYIFSVTQTDSMAEAYDLVASGQVQSRPLIVNTFF